MEPVGAVWRRTIDHCVQHEKFKIHAQNDKGDQGGSLHKERHLQILRPERIRKLEIGWKWQCTYSATHLNGHISLL